MNRPTYVLPDPTGPMVRSLERMRAIMQEHRSPCDCFVTTSAVAARLRAVGVYDDSRPDHCAGLPIYVEPNFVAMIATFNRLVADGRKPKMITWEVDDGSNELHGGDEADRPRSR